MWITENRNSKPILLTLYLNSLQGNNLQFLSIPDIPQTPAFFLGECYKYFQIVTKSISLDGRRKNVLDFQLLDPHYNIIIRERKSTKKSSGESQYSLSKRMLCEEGALKPSGRSERSERAEQTRTIFLDHIL